LLVLLLQLLNTLSLAAQHSMSYGHSNAPVSLQLQEEGPGR
jgi:hypothetical protein